MCVTALLPPPPTPITLIIDDWFLGKSNFNIGWEFAFLKVDRNKAIKMTSFFFY
jgi:hypothetical protein